MASSARGGDLVTPCHHLRCPHTADAWAHIGGRWLRLCLDHLADARSRGAVVGPPADQAQPPPPRERATEPDERTSDRATPIRPPHLAVRPAPVVRTRAEAEARAKEPAPEPKRRRFVGPPQRLEGRPAGRCACCEAEADPRRRGLCTACYVRARRHGVLDVVADAPVPQRLRGAA